jgi:hypothetical protein
VIRWWIAFLGGRPHDKQRAIGAAAVIDHADGRDDDTNQFRGRSGSG